MMKGLFYGTRSPDGSPHSPTPSPDTTSTANRDAAEELVAKAQQKSAGGDDDGAMTLVLKSLRLCDTESGQRLKLHLENFGDGTPAANQVQRVMKSPAGYHYALMGLMPTCTAAEVKKAYKQLSLVLHPDRNRARDAESAFKRLAEAFRVLGDAKEREAHDRKSGGGYADGSAFRGQGHTQAEAFARSERERQEIKRQREYYEATKRQQRSSQPPPPTSQQQRAPQPPPSSKPNGGSAQSSADSSETSKLRAWVAKLKGELERCDLPSIHGLIFIISEEPC